MALADQSWYIESAFGTKRPARLHLCVGWAIENTRGVPSWERIWDKTPRNRPDQWDVAQPPGRLNSFDLRI
jgi:hypothetical protein